MISKIKKNIFLSSPTCIIQLKHAFSGHSNRDYEKIVHYTFLNKDWENKENFSTVHEMKDLLSRKKTSNKSDLHQ